MTTRNDLTDLAHRLILRAARQAPAPLAARLQEEWLADLQSRSGALARLRLALGCCWATAVITRDFGVPRLATSGAVSGHRAHLADLQQMLPQLSRRTLTFILIGAVHVLLIYSFATGLAQQVAASIPQVIHASFSEERRPQPPPAVAPEFKPRKIYDLAPPVVDTQKIEFPPEAPAAKPKGGDGTADPETQVAAPPPQRLVGGPGKDFPRTDDYYPALSRRLEETGAATVQVCVDTQGRLSADPTLARTSGSRRIDAGALALARAGSGHYRPSTVAGQAVNSCYPYRIRFELN
jgi:TonB family protein